MAVAEARQMGRKKSPNRPEKTLKCSQTTWEAVSAVAALRGIDKAVYVDEVLGPIAERDLEAETRKRHKPSK